ncbi:response regulator [Xanthobacteraceae bacterium A53D]
MTAHREDESPNLLLVDADVVIRHAIAEYLRSCGYRVIEAASTDEAQNFLSLGEIDVSTVLADAKAPGRLGGFGFARWVRELHPQIDMILAAAPEKAAEEAATLCEEGPQLARPYDPQVVMDRVKRLHAARDRMLERDDS